MAVVYTVSVEQRAIETVASMVIFHSDICFNTPYRLRFAAPHRFLYNKKGHASLLWFRNGYGPSRFSLSVNPRKSVSKEDQGDRKLLILPSRFAT